MEGTASNTCITHLLIAQAEHAEAGDCQLDHVNQLRKRIPTSWDC
jgi:hypothetical protein